MQENLKKRAEIEAQAKRFFNEPMTTAPEIEGEPYYVPLQYSVLVRLEKTPEKIGSIHLPETRQEMSQMAQTFATVVRLGPLAFRDFEEDLRPEIGDRVLVGKYAGVRPESDNDRTLLRLVDDKDIVAIVYDKEPEKPESIEEKELEDHE